MNISSTESEHRIIPCIGRNGGHLSSMTDRCSPRSRRSGRQYVEAMEPPWEGATLRTKDFITLKP